MSEVEPLTLTLGGLLVAVLAAAVYWDLRERRIPDLLTYPALGLMLLARGLLPGGGLQPLGEGIAGALVAGGVLAAVAVFRKVGWGDVKLAAVAGAALGWPGAAQGLWWISVAGAGQALVTLGVRAVRRQAPARKDLPYAVAIALGSCWAIWLEANMMGQ